MERQRGSESLCSRFFSFRLKKKSHSDLHNFHLVCRSFLFSYHRWSDLSSLRDLNGLWAAQFESLPHSAVAFAVESRLQRKQFSLSLSESLPKALASSCYLQLFARPPADGLNRVLFFQQQQQQPLLTQRCSTSAPLYAAVCLRWRAAFIQSTPQMLELCCECWDKIVSIWFRILETKLSQGILQTVLKGRVTCALSHVNNNLFI